jgi:hypothetical protein
VRLLLQPQNKTDLLDYLHGLGAGIEQTYTIVDSTGWVNGRLKNLPKLQRGADGEIEEITIYLTPSDIQLQEITRYRGSYSQYWNYVLDRHQSWKPNPKRRLTASEIVKLCCLPVPTTWKRRFPEQYYSNTPRSYQASRGYYCTNFLPLFYR